MNTAYIPGKRAEKIAQTGCEALDERNGSDTITLKREVRRSDWRGGDGLNRWIRLMTQLGSLIYGKPTAQLIHLLWVFALLFLLVGIIYWVKMG